MLQSMAYGGSLKDSLFKNVSFNMLESLNSAEMSSSLPCLRSFLSNMAMQTRYLRSTTIPSPRL